METRCVPFFYPTTLSRNTTKKKVFLGSYIEYNKLIIDNIIVQVSSLVEYMTC